MVSSARNDEPLIDILTVINTLWQRRTIIVAVAGVIFASAFIYIISATRVYTAHAQILVDPRTPRATKFSSVLPGIGNDSAAIASQVSVIGSRSLLGAVFDSLKLDQDPEFSAPGLVSRILSFFHPPRPLSRDAIFDRYRNHVTVHREGLTYIIDIDFKSHDPKKAAKIANAIVAQYISSLAHETENANNQVSTLLGDKISGLQDSVSRSERAVEDFKSTHKIFDATTGGTLQSQIDQLTTKAITAEHEASLAEDRYKKAMASGMSPKGLSTLSQILSSGTADRLRDMYNSIVATLANYETIYGPQYPLIISEKAQLATVEGLMSHEASRIVKVLKARRDLAEQNVTELRAKIHSLRKRLNRSTLQQVHLQQLQRKAVAARTVLDNFLTRSQETAQIKGIQVSQVHEISKAVPPVAPTSPKPLLVLPISAVLALAAGCAVALSFNPRRTNYDSPSSPVGPRIYPSSTHAFPHPELVHLGVYSVPNTSADSRHDGFKAAKSKIAHSGEDPFSPQLQQLGHRITDHLRSQDKPVVIVVSSIQSSPTKALAATLIGAALKQMGVKILVLETIGGAGFPSPIRSAPDSRTIGPFTDIASGLQTAILLTKVASDNSSGHATTIEQGLREAGAGFDYVIIVRPPLDQAPYDPVLAAHAHLELFVLTQDEPSSAAALWSQFPMPLSNQAQRAIIVLKADAYDSAKEQFGPDLATSDTFTRRETPVPSS